MTASNGPIIYAVARGANLRERSADPGTQVSLHTQTLTNTTRCPDGLRRGWKKRGRRRETSLSLPLRRTAHPCSLSARQGSPVRAANKEGTALAQSDSRRQPISVHWRSATIEPRRPRPRPRDAVRCCRTRTRPGAGVSTARSGWAGLGSALWPGARAESPTTTRD